MRTSLATRRSLAIDARDDKPTVPAWWTKLTSDTTVSIVALGSLIATQVIGTLGAAAFLTAVLVLAGMRLFDTVRDLVKYAPLLVLPLLAMFSVMWSPAPQTTLRAAIQILITIIAAILIARRLSARRMVLVIFVGYLFVCLLLLPPALRSLGSGYPLYSSFLGSKNQVGFAAHMLLAASLAVMLDRDQFVPARVAAVLALPLASLIVFQSHSGGALASVMITLLTFIPLFILSRVKPSWRVALLAVAVLGLIVAVLLIPNIEAALADFRVNVLNKDATLTGRTHLWEVAAQISAQNPWLGKGYGAFWRQGNIDAEGLWRWGGIASRGGFNFHSAFVEMRVDLGWVGLSVLIAMCVGIAALGFARSMIKPTVPTAFLLSLLAVLYARSFTENGLVAPFSVATVLWIATAVYALSSFEMGSPSLRFRPRASLRARRSGAIARRV